MAVTSTNLSAGEPNLRDKLRAWWHGHDLPDEKKVKKRAAIVEQTPIPETLTRVEAVQRIWDEGFSSPGSAEDIVEMVKPLRLSPEISLLDLGAGLGGPDRAMVQASGIWVTGLEASRDFVAVGKEQATKAGLAKKATLDPFDPAEFELAERKFDRVFSKELLFTIADKPRLIAQVAKTLRPKGEFLFTDYVLAPAASAAKLEAWVKGESGPRYPTMASDLADKMKLTGFDVRIAEDITQVHVQQILNAFRKIDPSLVSLVEGGERTASALAVMSRELGVWMRRVELLQSGTLQVFRFHAIKPQSGRMMSNW